jgi:hypothetical protein
LIDPASTIRNSTQAGCPALSRFKERTVLPPMLGANLRIDKRYNYGKITTVETCARTKSPKSEQRRSTATKNGKRRNLSSELASVQRLHSKRLIHSCFL